MTCFEIGTVFSHIVIPRDFFFSHPHLLSNDATQETCKVRGSMRKKTSSWSRNLARSAEKKRERDASVTDCFRDHRPGVSPPGFPGHWGMFFFFASTGYLIYETGFLGVVC